MARPDPFIGKVIDQRYRLVEKIGAGGFGAVYRADHLRLGSPFAIKFMFPMLAQDEALIARFEREAKTTSQLHHPHIVDVVDFGEEPALGLYLVMEFLAGETLRQRIRRDGARDTASIIRIADPICQALMTAHQGGVIHRDLKPANIFLIRTNTRDDFVKILDFGIAGLADDGGKGLTKTGMIMGSPPYMSPEQAWARKLDHRTDIYSLGVILYEMATGTTPFRSESDVAILDMQRSATPIPPRRFRPDLDIPVGLEKVILRCLSKAPEERYQTIQAVRRELASLGVELGVSGITEIPSFGADEPVDEGATTIIPFQGPAAPSAAAPRVATVPQSIAAAAQGTAFDLGSGGPGSDDRPSQTGVAAESGIRTRRRAGPLLAGLAAAVVAAVLAITFWPSGSPPSEAPPFRDRARPAAEGPATPADPAGASATAVVTAPSAPDVIEAPREGAGGAEPAAPAAPAPAVETVPDPAPAVETVPDPAPAPGPDPAPAHLVLRTEPAGATVLRGEETLCETPCDLRIDATGAAETLLVRLDGYRDESCEVTLVGGADIDREIRLDRERRRPTARRPPKDEPDSAAGRPPRALPGIRLDSPKRDPAKSPSGLPKLRVE